MRLPFEVYVYHQQFASTMEVVRIKNECFYRKWKEKMNPLFEFVGTVALVEVPKRYPHSLSHSLIGSLHLHPASEKYARIICKTKTYQHASNLILISLMSWGGGASMSNKLFGKVRRKHKTHRQVNICCIGKMAK